MSSGLLLEPELPSVGGQALASEGEVASRAGTEAIPTVGEEEPIMNFDDDMMVFGDDDPALLPAAPQISLTPEPDGEEPQQVRQPSRSIQLSETSSETAEAPQRQTRPPKTIRPDRQTELSSRDLNEWNQNYLMNMAAALHIKENHFALSRAKKNAEFWVFQQGLGNVASMFGDEREQHPFAIFSGQSLWDMLRGPKRGTKRTRTASILDEQEGEDRRVRARPSPAEEVARGQEDDIYHYAEDDAPVFQDEEFEIEPEVGRHAPPSLPDSSGMPWNISAGGSRQSSVRPLGSGPHTQIELQRRRSSWRDGTWTTIWPEQTRLASYFREPSLRQRYTISFKTQQSRALGDLRTHQQWRRIRRSGCAAWGRSRP